MTNPMSYLDTHKMRLIISRIHSNPGFKEKLENLTGTSNTLCDLDVSTTGITINCRHSCDWHNT
jgi:hypothetical protein